MISVEDAACVRVPEIPHARHAQDGAVATVPVMLTTRTGTVEAEAGIEGRAQWRGLRWWWLCPMCGSRRGKLHAVVTSRGPVLGCRGCLRLVYRSQCLSKRQRDAIARAPSPSMAKRTPGAF